MTEKGLYPLSEAFILKCNIGGMVLLSARSRPAKTGPLEEIPNNLWVFFTYIRNQSTLSFWKDLHPSMVLPFSDELPDSIQSVLHTNTQFSSGCHLDNYAFKRAMGGWGGGTFGNKRSAGLVAERGFGWLRSCIIILCGVCFLAAYMSHAISSTNDPKKGITSISSKGFLQLIN